MGKRKPHPSGRPPKKPAPTEEDEEKGTIYFYMPNEKPYGIFCQWHPSPFSIPIASLQWLVDLAPPPPLPPSTTSTTTTSAFSILSAHASTSPGSPTPFLSFACAEQSYMYCKSLFFSDLHTCALILSTPDPKTQKKHGQRITNFSFTAWSAVKSRVARVGNWYKFTGPGNGNRHMRSVLLGTGERELAEAGRRDRVWGIGYRAFEAEGYREWWGENLLGKCLEDVRGRIREMDRRVKEEGEAVDWDWDGELDGDGDGVGEVERGEAEEEEAEEEEAEEEEADTGTIVQDVEQT